ncbi:MAG: hypothetical protein HPY69_17880 [Armatimonadetes bacterium]|nr:hypothetical protein [Armatimonadota bacterium]
MRGQTTLFALAGMVLFGPVLGQDLPLQPYSYEEGFETGDLRLQLWASNGSPPEIHFNGPTNERAFAGQRSLKLDVTLGDGSYYYLGVPVRVPCAGRVRLSARMLVTETQGASVGFGTNTVYPPSHHSGCGPIESFGGPTGDWELIEADMVERGAQNAAQVLALNAPGLKASDVAVFLDRWSVFLYGSGKRVTLYLDDIRIEGETPDPDAYTQVALLRTQAAREAFIRRVDGWQAELEALRSNAAYLDQAPKEAAHVVRVLREVDRRTGDLLARLRRDGYGSDTETAEVQQALATLRTGPDVIAALSSAQAQGRGFVVCAQGQAISQARHAEAMALPSSALSQVLECSGCRGEIESLSATVHALREVRDLRVTVSDLRHVDGPGSIPASAVDIRVVKSWFQGAGNNIGYSPQKVLKPELLLKDDDLVRVYVGRQENWVRSTAPGGSEEYIECTGQDSTNMASLRPRDARELQPLRIRAGAVREYWINVHIPIGARAGEYQGALTFRAVSGSVELPLRVTVHPFDLAPSRLIYSIYYRGFLAPDGQPTISSEGKSAQQYAAEIANMRDHGVLYPTNYQAWDPVLLPRVMQIRRQAGLPTERFYNLGQGVGQQQTEQERQSMVARVKDWLALARRYGYEDVYFYGIDEATGERLEAQKLAWKAAQEAGGKTFVACYQGTFEAMGALLNCAVLAGAPDTEEVRKWHSVGSHIFCYANPQVGVEDPMVYRRNFGLKLWQAGYDGAMDYAYQHGFHHVWNDFDDPSYRDHNFTYPTVDGVIDTIQWEGFREAVDDVRYLTTLERALEQAPADKAALVAEIRDWLRSDLASQDLDSVRAQVVQWMERLSEPTVAEPQTAPSASPAPCPPGGG